MKDAARQTCGAFLQGSGQDNLAELDFCWIDRLLAEYFDVLFWKGFQYERGSKMLAGVQHHRPVLGRGSHGNLPVARVALVGFQVHAHGSSRKSITREWVLGVVGVSLLENDIEYAAALWLSWDAMLRLPSDLLFMSSQPPASSSGG